MSNNNRNHKVRKVLRTNWIYETFRVPDPRTGKMLVCDASLERDFALKNVLDSDVIYIDTKPQSFFCEATEKRYTRDVVIGKKDLKVINYEVGTSARSLIEKYAIKFNRIDQEIKEKGGDYKVVTEDDIHDGYLIPNLKRLNKYRETTKPSSDCINSILRIVESHPKFTFGELKTVSRVNCFNVRNIWYCLAYNILLTDLTKRIENDSIVWSINDEV